MKHKQFWCFSTDVDSNRKYSDIFIYIRRLRLLFYFYYFFFFGGGGGRGFNLMFIFYHIIFHTFAFAFFSLYFFQHFSTGLSRAGMGLGFDNGVILAISRDSHSRSEVCNCL